MGGNRYWSNIDTISDSEIKSLFIETVDLGLPSGLLWATCNLGADKPEDYGLYFQWADTKGYKGACSESESDGNDDLHYFLWSKYKYCDGQQDVKLTKYCTRDAWGTLDNKTVIEPEDDAAVAMFGGQWRMPTSTEFRELIDNTVPGDGANSYGWINNYNSSGVNGILRKSKTNDNTIFFPAPGQCNANVISSAGSSSNYWTNSLGNTTSTNGVFMQSNYAMVVFGDMSRFIGLPIRAVTTK